MNDLAREITALLPSLQAYARKLARHRENAEDLVQTCMLRAFDNLDQFEPGTNLRAWLYTILKNTHHNSLRKRSRYYEAFDIALYENAVATPALQLIHLEAGECLSAAHKLDDANRLLVILALVEGYSYEEAAQELDLPLGTVRSRLSRSRSKIRTMIEAGPDSTNPQIHD